MLDEPSSHCSKSTRFCKTTTLIKAMPSHYMNQGSIITILCSIKMITTSYRLISLQLSKSQNFFFKYSSKCCSTSHALTCLLHNLNRHYHVQWSFPYLPIRGQTNSVHISHRKADFAFTGPSQELKCCTMHLTLLSTHILYEVR